MNEAEIKACPFCGKPPTIKQAGKTNYWWVGCEIHLGPESSGCGVSHSDYKREEAIRKWNERAGDRQPAMSKTPEPSTLASATCSAAGIERERHLVLVLEEITALICYQPEFPSKHKEDLIDRLKGFKAASAAAQQQNDQAHPTAAKATVDGTENL